MAIVVNLSNTDIILNRGERICQIILGKVHRYEFKETDKLPESERGLGGFGSTGKKWITSIYKIIELKFRSIPKILVKISFIYYLTKKYKENSYFKGDFIKLIDFMLKFF